MNITISGIQRILKEKNINYHVLFDEKFCYIKYLLNNIEHRLTVKISELPINKNSLLYNKYPDVFKNIAALRYLFETLKKEKIIDENKIMHDYFINEKPAK